MDALSERKEVKPIDDNERVIWCHAFWARLRHAQEKFIPTQAKDVAEQILVHARNAGVVGEMAAMLRAPREKD